MSFIQNLINWDDARSVIINVISQYVYLITGPFILIGMVSFGKTIYNRTRLARRVIGIPYRARSVAIIFGIVPPVKNARKGYFSVEEGDVSALLNVYGFIRDLIRPYKPTVLSHIDSDNALVNSEYVISISGPVWNPITSYLLENFKQDVYFDLANETLVTPRGPLKTSYSKNGVPTECYGILVSGKRQTSRRKEQKYLVACGNSNLSTLGSTIVFEELGHLLKSKIGIWKTYLLARKGRYCLVIKVTNNAENNSQNRLPYRNGLIEFEIDQVIF